MTTYANRISTIAAALLLLIAGCDLVGSDDDGRGDTGQVFVANQGNFGDANGSVTVFNPHIDQYRQVEITGLASIVQSVSLVDGKLYVMANSGNRIKVFDAASLLQIAQIERIVSPRYLLVDGSTGYVTNLYGSIGQFTGGMVTVLDLENDMKIEEIAVGDNPEGMALVGTRLHVANNGFGAGRTLHVIDTESREAVDTVDVECDGPRFLAADEENEVIVFCTGNTVWGDEGIVSQTNGAIRVIDGTTGEIVDRIEIDGQIGTVGPGQDAYYVPEDDLIVAVLEASTLLFFDTETHSITDTIGPLDGSPIGAVALNSLTDQLYLGRSNGYTAAGEVTIHTMEGAKVDSFAAGVVPTYITFSTDS